MSAPLLVGVPTEIKPDEGRVALTPDGVRELHGHGVDVVVQSGAGEGASIPDDDFRAVGAEIAATADEVWERAGLICKVKEPQESELPHLRSDQVLFTYLHLAAYPGVADALLAAGTTAVAYETVQATDGQLPLLAPMSEVAGRMSIQVGAHFLERHNGGRGVLLGGVPGVRPASVVVLGAGNVGWNAAWMAAGLEADGARLETALEAGAEDVVTGADGSIYMLADVATEVDSMREVLTMLAGDDPGAKYRELMAQRVPLFKEVATLRVNTNRRNPGAVVRHIVHRLEQPRCDDHSRRRRRSAWRRLPTVLNPGPTNEAPPSPAALAKRLKGSNDRECR